jgi:segregation and condensation protein B
MEESPRSGTFYDAALAAIQSWSNPDSTDKPAGTASRTDESLDPQATMSTPAADPEPVDITNSPTKGEIGGPASGEGEPYDEPQPEGPASEGPASETPPSDSAASDGPAVAIEDRPHPMGAGTEAVALGEPSEAGAGSGGDAPATGAMDTEVGGALFPADDLIEDPAYKPSRTADDAGATPEIAAAGGPQPISEGADPALAQESAGDPYGEAVEAVDEAASAVPAGAVPAGAVPAGAAPEIDIEGGPQPTIEGAEAASAGEPPDRPGVLAGAAPAGVGPDTGQSAPDDLGGQVPGIGSPVEIRDVELPAGEESAPETDATGRQAFPAGAPAFGEAGPVAGSGTAADPGGDAAYGDLGTSPETGTPRDGVAVDRATPGPARLEGTGPPSAGTRHAGAGAPGQLVGLPVEIAAAVREGSGEGEVAAAATEPDEFDSPERLRAAVEAILLVVDTPTEAVLIAQVLGRPVVEIEAALGSLRAEYDAGARGMDLREVAGGWRLYTRDDFAGYIERFVLEGQQTRLTQAALETLAVIAYRQPITRSRVSAIRGVNVDAVMRTLLTRGLVEECGSDTDTGGGLYKTTAFFLERLGISSLDELPSLAPLLPDTSQLDDVALST